MSDEQWKALFGEERVHHKVTVYNREGFEANVTKEEVALGDKAYIEIYSGPNGYPVLDPDTLSLPNVIALDFEDMPEDVRFSKSTYQPTNPTITYKDAKTLVDFIERFARQDKDFVVHCDAGVSRSQQVAAYIMMSYWYEYDEENSSHNHHFAQTVVLSRLLETRHKTIPAFNNKDNAFRYDEVLHRWIER